MKKTLLIFIIMILVIIPIMAEVSEQKHKHVITSNALNFIIRTFSIEYETQVKPSLGAFVTFRYGYYDIGGLSSSWPGLSIGVHYYPRGADGLTGIFVGPLLYMNFMTTEFNYYTFENGLERKTDKVTGIYIGPMGVFGHRWDWGDFAFTPSIMFGILLGRVKSDLANTELNYGGFSYGLGLNMGMTF